MMKLKKKRKKSNWDLLDVTFDLVEPLYLLIRGIARIIIKIVD
jgi:hypothetical protein